MTSGRLTRWCFVLVLPVIVIGALVGRDSLDALAAPQPFPETNPRSGDPEAIEEGGKLYFKWCAACHGAKADGESRFGSYAADLTKFWRGYCDFVVLVLNGRPKKQMPPWGGILTLEEISKIGAFLESVAAENANWTGRCDPSLL